MTSDLYALIALAARYWFAALIVALLFRGWRMTVADNRRAKLLREWMGQTGCVGELIANPGSKKRVSYPIPREGVLGSALSADVRVRHREVERAHAHFELREGGLLMKPLGRAALKVGGGFTGETVFLQDGDVLTIGRLELMLVLFDAPMEEEADQWFEVASDADWPDEGAGDFDDFYAPQPQGALRPARRARKAPADPDAPFEAVGAKPRRSPAKRRRKAAADSSLPFDLAPAPGRGRRAAGVGARRQTAPDDDFDDFNEDSIWLDQ